MIKEVIKEVFNINDLGDKGSNVEGLVQIETVAVTRGYKGSTVEGLIQIEIVAVTSVAEVRSCF